MPGFSSPAQWVTMNRRYFEAVAPYARRLLQQVAAPHMQEITGLPATIRTLRRA